MSYKEVLGGKECTAVATNSHFMDFCCEKNGFKFMNQKVKQ